MLGGSHPVKNNYGLRALRYAAVSSGGGKTMQLLLEKGAEIEAEDKNGRRALHLASSYIDASS